MDFLKVIFQDQVFMGSLIGAYSEGTGQAQNRKKSQKRKKSHQQRHPRRAGGSSRKIGLAIMRLQPLHSGHAHLLQRMLQDMEVVIIGLGSVQEYGSLLNPFTADQRKEFIQIVTNNSPKVKVVDLTDIGPVSKQKWLSHVFGCIKEAGLPKPNYYYLGIQSDPGDYVGAGMQMKVVDRSEMGIGGTDICEGLQLNDSTWEKYVPQELVSLIKQHFPRQLLGKQ